MDSLKLPSPDDQMTDKAEGPVNTAFTSQPSALNRVILGDCRAEGSVPILCYRVGERDPEGGAASYNGCRYDSASEVYQDKFNLSCSLLMACCIAVTKTEKVTLIAHCAAMCTAWAIKIIMADFRHTTNELNSSEWKCH